MNRKRCPWCGKVIDKAKDKDHSFWQNAFPGYSILHKADCSYCGHKYGQFPIFPRLLMMNLLVVVLVVLTFAFQSAILFVLLLVSIVLDLFMHVFMPYSKLDDRGKPSEENTDLYCKFVVLEKYSQIKCYELYFLNDCFDNFDTFVLSSPIQVYSIPKKSNIISGEYIYMHEKNDDYMKKDSCELYDSEMNLIAKIKFIEDDD